MKIFSDGVLVLNLVLTAEECKDWSPGETWYHGATSISFEGPITNALYRSPLGTLLLYCLLTLRQSIFDVFEFMMLLPPGIAAFQFLNFKFAEDQQMTS